MVQIQNIYIAHHIDVLHVKNFVVGARFFINTIIYKNLAPTELFQININYSMSFE